MTYQVIEDRCDEVEDSFLVYEIGVYKRGSVLAGQARKTFLDAFGSLAEAKTAYPKAEEIEGRYECRNTFGHLPDGPDVGY